MPPQRACGAGPAASPPLHALLVTSYRGLPGQDKRVQAVNLAERSDLDVLVTRPFQLLVLLALRQRGANHRPARDRELDPRADQGGSNGPERGGPEYGQLRGAKRDGNVVAAPQLALHQVLAQETPDVPHQVRHVTHLVLADVVHFDDIAVANPQDGGDVVGDPPGHTVVADLCGYALGNALRSCRRPDG